MGEKGITSVLMDTGSSPEVIAHNLEVMGLDLRRTDAIFLSHGHYDHCGGLLQVLKAIGRPVPIIAHPRAFDPKFVIKPSIRFVGSPFKISEIEAAGGIPILVYNPFQMAEGIIPSVEVKREAEFERIDGFWTIEDGRFMEDHMPDDQALFLELENKGLVILTGCAHSGIVNLAMHAKRLQTSKPIYAIIGGFHLSEANDDRIAKTVEEIRRLNIQFVAPCHCTGIRALSQLMEAFGNRCMALRTGDVMSL
ncbi:MBL fold metallo-hydrolase [Candidatus Bathyarchaeota archaeon]|nr:MBL fold metallo-hydrolase [Candidatus Bathyarchaeota archaeon]